MVAKKPEDRYGSMSEVIAELEACATPKPKQFAETANLGNTPHSSANMDTLPVIRTEETPGDSLPLDFPVISPVDSVLRKRPKMDKKQQIIIGSVAAGVCFLVLLFGVVFMMRMPEGTLVVEINEPDAEISVDDGKVTLKSPGEEPVEIEVVEGQHTLKVTKGGFQTFTKEFTIESGGKETISVELRPVEKKVAARPKPEPVPKVVSSSDNWALEFDGKSSGVHIPTLEYDGSHPITMEAFVLPRTHARSYIIRSARMGLMAADSGHLWQTNLIMHEPHALFQISQTNTKERELLHLACVFNGQRLALYVNGKKCLEPIQRVSDEANEYLNEDELISGTLQSGNYYLGSHKNEQEFFHGLIDEVRISNIARYTKDFAPQKRFEPDEHTLALYHFDEGSGDVLKDSSGNGHDGLIVGARWGKVGEELKVLEERPVDPPKPTPKPPAESPKPEPAATSETTTEKSEGDKTPKISWILRHTLTGHTDEVRSVAFHPKGVMVVSGGKDGTIRFWNVESGKQFRFIQDSGYIRDVTISPNGQSLAAVGDFGGVKMWDFSCGQPVGQLGSPAGKGICVAFSPDGSALTWFARKVVWLYNLRTQEAVQFPHEAEEFGTSTAFSLNGNLLASGASDGSVQLWNTRTGKLAVQVVSGGGGSRGFHSHVAFSQDGLRLAAGGHGWNQNLRLWDVQTGDPQATFDEPGGVNAVAASPTKPIIASGGQQDENRIRLGDMASGEILAKLAGHEDHILSVAFSKDGKLLVSGSRDKTVRIWEITVEP